MTETELYEYVVKKAVSFGMKPKNIPGGYKLEDVSPDEGGNAIIRHSLMKGAYIGLIDSGQSIIEDNFDSTTSEISHLEKTFTDLGFSKNESKSMKEIIESYEKDVWLRSNSFGTKMKNVIKTFSYSGKKVKSQTKLFEKLSEKKIIETKKEGSVDYFKIIK